MGEAFHGVAPNRGAFFLFAEHYGAVRCDATRILIFQEMRIFVLGFLFLHCCVMRCSSTSCGAVRFTFKPVEPAPHRSKRLDLESLRSRRGCYLCASQAVRFGADFKVLESCGTVWFGKTASEPHPHREKKKTHLRKTMKIHMTYQ